MRSVHGGFAMCVRGSMELGCPVQATPQLICTPAGYVLLPHALFIPKLKARRSDLSPLRPLGLLLSPFHLPLPSVPPHLPGLPERELSVRRVEHAAECFLCLSHPRYRRNPASCVTLPPCQPLSPVAPLSPQSPQSAAPPQTQRPRRPYPSFQLKCAARHQRPRSAVVVTSCPRPLAGWAARRYGLMFWSHRRSHRPFRRARSHHR
mmetsp:Transcript_7877/g.18773  ORF Transcript_7877/g.18773 Transcript_7877/m.18773 type:complete len:206 (+) Transcript_7877:232-849(+)